MTESVLPIDVIVIALVVSVVFMSLKFIAQPPRHVVEGVFEAHKVILVGGVSLAGAASVELLLVAPKLADAALLQEAQTGLFCGTVIAVVLLAGAVTRPPTQTNRMDWLFLMQIVLGVVVLSAVTFVTYKFRPLL